MKTKAHITITEAANLAGVSRATLYNRIKEGKLSLTPDGIDIADLRRVYAKITQVDVERVMHPEALPTVEIEHPDALKMSVMVEWLQKLIDERDKVIAQKDEQLDAARERIDQLSDHNVRLLEAPRSEGQGRGGWISRWF